MSPQTATNLATYSLLGAAAAISLSLPASLQPRSSGANPPAIPGETTLQVNTVVRDFAKGHPDFGASISGGNGHYAGNVSTDLSSGGKPSYVGVISTPVTNFNITNGATVPQVQYTPMITILGAAVQSGNYNCPVTATLHIGSQSFTPWGAFDKALAGNVNTPTGNPRRYTHPSALASGTPVWVEGRVFTKKQSSYSGLQESHWQVYSTYGSSPTNAQVKVLRNGDTVPNVDGFKNQASIKSFLTGYVDTAKQKVTIQSNQTIYLFEFGSTSGAAADFQDLVVLVTLGETNTYLNSLTDTGAPPVVTTTPKGYKVNGQWRDAAGNPIPPALMGTMAGDAAGTKGSASTGGIYSAQSFDQWFTDVMGTNLSAQSPITLTKNKDSVWEFLSDSFHPVDNQLLGNESKDHNFYFTMNFAMDFTHHAGEHRFVEFRGDDDMWVFIDGKLAMDIGGIVPGTRQYLDVDRLGLSDGQQHHIEFFYAQRNENNSSFRLRTNLDLGAGTTKSYAVSGVGD